MLFILFWGEESEALSHLFFVLGSPRDSDCESRQVEAGQHVSTEIHTECGQGARAEPVTAAGVGGDSGKSLGILVVSLQLLMDGWMERSGRHFSAG